MNLLLEAMPQTSLADSAPPLLESSRQDLECLTEARRAQQGWAGTNLRNRIEVIRGFRGLLADKSMELAESAARASCRSPAEILASEILPLADACRFLEREAQSILASRRVGRRGRPLWLAGTRAEVRREPFGVVLIIAPGNYPLFLPGVQTIQALVAGNALRLKPGMGGTTCALALARLLDLAGLPAGLLRVLPEAPSSARATIALGVDKVIFTGSLSVGTQVLAQLAPRAVPATMELSSSDAAFVRADADLDLAVKALHFALRLNGGRTCIAPRRVFVAREIADDFAQRLTAALADQRLNPIPRGIGDRLPALLEEVTSAGARLISGRVDSDGRVSGPLILDRVPFTSRLLREEFFAPVLSIAAVENDRVALQVYHECPYALGAVIFSQDFHSAEAMAWQINAGVVVINDLIVPTADARLPFGGRGLSGFGVTRGREGLIEMTRPKVVIQRHGKRYRHLENPIPGDEQIFASYIAAAHGIGLRSRLTAAWKLLHAAADRGRMIAFAGATRPVGKAPLSN